MTSVQVLHVFILMNRIKFDFSINFKLLYNHILNKETLRQYSTLTLYVISESCSRYYDAGFANLDSDLIMECDNY